MYLLVRVHYSKQTAGVDAHYTGDPIRLVYMIRARPFNNNCLRVRVFEAGYLSGPNLLLQARIFPRAKETGWWQPRMAD